MQDNLLLDALETLLQEQATPAMIRAIEGGGAPTVLWSAIEESGFCDALVAEARGGAGLSLAEIFPLVEACGVHALPLPLAQTMVARLLLTGAGENVPAGAIALASAPSGSQADIPVPYGRVANWVLLAQDAELLLLDARLATVTMVDTHSTDAHMAWPASALARPRSRLAGDADLRSIEAGLLAAQLSGAMRRVFALTLQYANERSQFGRSIGKFQAIQHQLSVMAEHTAAAQMAARAAFATHGQLPQPLACAVAKARTSEATMIVAAGAHGIHGAIGITEEYDLQLYTRRLHAWRAAAGTESYWNVRIGRALLASRASNVIDFVRHELASATA
jgi:acyl-CoA dehydrogenase